MKAKIPVYSGAYYEGAIDTSSMVKMVIEKKG